MVHSCVDWTAAVPTRKTQLMVLSHGSVHKYAKVPDRFEDLEALARKKFSLDDADLAFYSSCMNFCSETLAEVSPDVWAYAAPFIGCITVVEKTSSCQASTKTLPPKATTIPTNSSDAVALPTSVVLVGDNNTSEGTDEGIDTSQIDEAHHTVEGGGLSASVQTAANQSDGRSMPDVVIPLRKSPDRWVAPSMTCSNETSRAPYFPMVIVRKLTGLLNKLSPRNYGRDVKDSLSDERAPSVSRQIITLLNICEGEDGGWVLSSISKTTLSLAETLALPSA